MQAILDYAMISEQLMICNHEQVIKYSIGHKTPAKHKQSVFQIIMWNKGNENIVSHTGI